MKKIPNSDRELAALLCLALVRPTPRIGRSKTGQDHFAVCAGRRRRHAWPAHRRAAHDRISSAVLCRESRRRRRHHRRRGRRRGRARRLHAGRIQHRVERDLAGVQRQSRLRRHARLHPYRLSRRPAGGDDRASLARRDHLQGFRRDFARASKEPLSYISPGTGSNGFLVARVFGAAGTLQAQPHPLQRRRPGDGRPASPATSSSAPSRSRPRPSRSAPARCFALAVTTEKRIPNFPDIPTFKEAGQDLVAATWFALSGPAKLPNDIVQAISRETLKAMQTPDVQKRLALDAIETKLMSPEEFTKFVAGRNQRAGRRWRSRCRRLSPRSSVSQIGTAIASKALSQLIRSTRFWTMRKLAPSRRRRWCWRPAKTRCWSSRYSTMMKVEPTRYSPAGLVRLLDEHVADEMGGA